MQDTPYNIQFNQRAKVALDALSEEFKDSVLQAINRLEVSRVETELGVRRLKTDKPDEELYASRVEPIFGVIIFVIFK